MSKQEPPSEQPKSVSKAKHEPAGYGRFEMVDGDNGPRMVWHPPPTFRTKGIAYSPQLAEVICHEIASGKTLSDVCRQEGWPGYAVVAGWRKRHKEFDAALKLAMEVRANAMADEIMEIADETSEDWIESKDPRRPGKTLNKEAVLRSRVRIDTRKWLMGRLYPKKWGEKIEIDQTVKVEEGPVDVMKVARKVAFLLTNAKAEDVVDAEVTETKSDGGVVIPNFMFLQTADDLSDDDDTE